MTTRYMIPTMAQVWKDMKVFACTFFAVLTSSGKPMTDRMEVSFTVMMNWLMMLGIIVRIACGMMIFRIVVQYGRPRDRPASICPMSTDWIPARMISAMYAPQFSARQMVPACSADIVKL